MDPRIEKLSNLLTDYSCDVQPGEKVLITYEGECCKSLARQLINQRYIRQRRSAVLRNQRLPDFPGDTSGMHGGADQVQG